MNTLNTSILTLVTFIPAAGGLLLLLGAFALTWLREGR